MEIIPAKTMGTDLQKSQMMQDRLGRIFIASRSLLVFDGQTWRSHDKPGEASLSFLAEGPDGILWTGTSDHPGYFREERFGDFKFHSLKDQVPASALPLGSVWGCAPLGAITYFVCNEKLLRWDGRGFQVTPFPTNRRLAPLRIGGEHWVQHPETGLYRLTETGPELSFPADQLPVPLIIGLFRDESGLVTVSNDGLRRPGREPHSPPELKEYLTLHRVSAFCELPDGNLVFGTLSGGLILTSRTGHVIRLWADANSGLPGRTIISLTTDSTGEVFGTTPTDFFHFPSTGESTVFNARNGLRGQAVNAFVRWNSTLYAATDDGAYQQVAGGGDQASFRSLPLLGARYNAMLPHGVGLLLTRFGGVDWFGGGNVKPVFSLTANSALQVATSRADPRAFHVTEYRGGVARVTQKSDGHFEKELLTVLPGTPTSLHEGPDNRLWIGTIAHGAFIFDPAARALVPLHDPATDRPFEEPVRIVGNDDRMLLFVNGRVLQADPRDRQLRVVPGIPAFAPAVLHQLGSGNVLIAYERPAVTGPLHGAGLLSFATDGTAAWREFDLSHLDVIGSIGTMDFAEEGGQPVLWLGGIEGILRLDYAQIPTLAAPTAPTIRLLGEATSRQVAGTAPEYPFKEHLLRFRIFTGDYLRGKDWLFQSRLGRGEWSAPVVRRSFDYSSLSEGVYEFEVRAVNSAGIVGPAATFTFRILPPWYRSTRALIGYAAALLLVVVGFIRVRERRIRIRNQELETLVGIRTAELVKASAAKDEFLAGVSHEIRNPMNGVIGIAENFRTEGLDLESRRKFSLLRQCASHLSSLLEDILDFSKVQAGAIELDPKPFDLVDLVESVGAITRPDSEKYGIPVELAVSPAVPRELVGDARRIRQILINFVSNALKFSGRGQVSVTVWCKSLGPAQTEVIFTVSDEGPGISAEEQTRLFTRFERGAAAQKGRVPGTGLGLALCKGIAEKMGGRLWLESELGHGSCFYFSAPFALAEAPAGPAAAVTSRAAPGTRTALVVDDQEYNRIVLADLLQVMGFTVHSAQEGSAALNLAAKEAFDVVFLDFNLPGLSGVDVARGIRALPGPTAHALVLATTAFTTPEKRAQCLDAGMDAFLGKPVTKDRLVKALAGLIPVKSAASPAAGAGKPPNDGPGPAKAGPADRLGNLRLLARKKGVPFADELALYFSELDTELGQLNTAITHQNAVQAGRYAHMLCGRCSFVYESDLEQTQRKIEGAVGAGQWDEARRLGGEFAAQLADLRIRLASSGPAVPPA